jgi:hypothetical protein
MRRVFDVCIGGLCVACLVVALAGMSLALYRDVSRERPKPFTAEANDVALVAVTEEGTRVYRVFGPKMLYATVIVVGPDGRASIRQ